MARLQLHYVCLHLSLQGHDTYVKPLDFTRYSCSKTHGLFGGVSIEGSIFIEWQDITWTSAPNIASVAKLTHRIGHSIILLSEQSKHAWVCWAGINGSMSLRQTKIMHLDLGMWWKVRGMRDHQSYWRWRRECLGAGCCPRNGALQMIQAGCISWQNQVDMGLGLGWRRHYWWIFEGIILLRAGSRHNLHWISNFFDLGPSTQNVPPCWLSYNPSLFLPLTQRDFPAADDICLPKSLEKSLCTQCSFSHQQVTQTASHSMSFSSWYCDESIGSQFCLVLHPWVCNIALLVALVVVSCTSSLRSLSPILWVSGLTL